MTTASQQLFTEHHPDRGPAAPGPATVRETWTDPDPAPTGPVHGPLVRRGWELTAGHIVSAIPAGVALGLAGQQAGPVGLLTALAALAALVGLVELVRARARQACAARKQAECNPDRDSDLLTELTQLCQSQGRVPGPRRIGRDLHTTTAEARRLLGLFDALRRYRAEQRQQAAAVMANDQLKRQGR